MTLQISSELRAKLISEAQKAHPLECCGLLMGHGETVTEVRPAANVSDTPHTHFEIDPAVLIAAEKAVRPGVGLGAEEGTGKAILGYYHSHPSGEAMPSETDAIMAAMDGRYWIVIAGDAMGVFRAVKDGEIWGRFEGNVGLVHKV